MAEIVVPAAWAVLTNNERRFETSAPTLGEALEELSSRFPSLRPRLLNERGAIPSYTNVFIGDESCKLLQGVDTAIADDTVVTIIPAVTGG